MALTQQRIEAVTSALSPVRLGTYLHATGFSQNATALDIYVWNALVSGALFSSLHICEVVIRNAISHALELKYGANWPWESRFERTLSSRSKLDLQSARGGKGTSYGATGKVIADLKFKFWCNLFTAGQDQHIWNASLRIVFPFAPFPLTVAAVRKQLYDDMEALRIFRNRIAHHEPIFSYPISQYQQRIVRLINMRCGQTAQWLAQWELVSATLLARP